MKLFTDKERAELVEGMHSAFRMNDFPAKPTERIEAALAVAETAIRNKTLEPVLEALNWDQPEYHQEGMGVA